MTSWVYRYGNVDGVWELGFGAMWFYLGLTMSLYLIFPDAYPPLISLTGWGVPLIGLGVERLKRRYTHPRTGYAVPRSPPRYLIFVFGIGLVLINLLDTFVWKTNFMTALVQPLSLGLMTGSLLLWVGGGLARFYYLAAASLLWGAALSVYGVGMHLGVVLHSTVLGLVLIVSGVVHFRRYLKAYPEP